MRRPVVLASLLAAAFATSLALAPTAGAATSAIKFTRIQYSPPGDDTPITNTKLKKEWVKLKNTSSSRTINIGGWKLHDSGQDHEYFFPSTRLSPDETVYVHTGSGSSSSGHRFLNLDNYVWNNDGDTATLRKSGVVKDRCGWTSEGDGDVTC